MIALWFFGRSVEYRYGKREYLTFFLVSVAAAGVTVKVSGELERQDFTLTAPGNAPATDFPKTIIYDLTGKPRTSRRLAQLLNAELRQGAPEGVATSADIVVVVGQDAAK